MNNNYIVLEGNDKTRIAIVSTDEGLRTLPYNAGIDELLKKENILEKLSLAMEEKIAEYSGYKYIRGMILIPLIFLGIILLTSMNFQINMIVGTLLPAAAIVPIELNLYKKMQQATKSKKYLLYYLEQLSESQEKLESEIRELKTESIKLSTEKISRPVTGKVEDGEKEALEIINGIEKNYYSKPKVRTRRLDNTK